MRTQTAIPGVSGECTQATSKRETVTRLPQKTAVQSRVHGTTDSREEHPTGRCVILKVLHFHAGTTRSSDANARVAPCNPPTMDLVPYTATTHYHPSTPSPACYISYT